MRRFLILLALAAAVPQAAFAATWANESAMKNENDALLRMSYVYDPTQGKMITESALATQSKYLNFYDNYGFDKNFMVWAPLVSNYNPGTAKWSECHTATWQPHPSAFCPGWLEWNHKVSDDIGTNRITAKVYNGRFIAMVCGNFNSGGKGPIPKLVGTKFLDANRNAVRDAGEPGLAGWVIDLYYNGTLVATTATSSTGAYTFAVDATRLPINAGTFYVRERLQPGWEQTTPNPASVNVPLGAGLTTYQGGNFGNYPQKLLGGRAIAVGVVADPLPSVVVSDTGWVQSVEESKSVTTEVASVDEAALDGTLLRSRVDLTAGSTADPSTSSASSQVATAAIVLPSGDVIEFEGIKSSSASSCSGSTSSVRFASLRVNGVEQLPDGVEPAEGTTIDLAGGGQIRVNEREDLPAFASELPEGDWDVGRRVTAIHVVAPGVNVVVASATSAIGNCA